MTEYGLVTLLVGVAAIAILVLFGGEVWELYESSESQFDSSRKSVPPPD